MRKGLSLLLVVCLLLSVMLPIAVVPAAAEDGQVSEGLVSQTVGNIRLQFLSPTLVRLEEKGPKGFEDRETFHIVNRTDWDGDRVEKTETDSEVVFTTSAAKVTVPKDAATLDGVKIYDLDGTLLYTYAPIDSNKQDLPAFSERVDAWAIADTPRYVPSEWGFDLMSEGAELSYGTKDTNGWDLENDAEDVYVFLPGNDHRQLRSDFVSLTGRTEMLPLSALGAWDSRYHPYTEESAMQQINDYHGHDLPLDVLVIDTDWRDAANGMGYDINTTLFPDMERFFQKAHDENVMIIFNDHPEPTKDASGRQNNVLKEAEVLYRQTNLQRLLNMGLDGWWYDRNWASTVIPLDGFTHEVMGMATFAAAQKAAQPNGRLFMMSNVDGDQNGKIGFASNLAAHRYGIQWTGDTTGHQETIWQEIQAALTFGEVSALPYVSTDVYTHFTMSESITDNEYIRWTQFGTLSPIFRPHVRSGDAGRMPWLRGEAVTDIFREYVNLRYRLLPVYYQLSHENYETGMPMLRPMTADYPEYAGADRDDEYLLGEDIFIAPVVVAGGYDSVPAQYFTTPDGQPGVKMEFFNNVNLSGSPVLTQTAKDINFDWGEGNPNSSLGKDNFSIRVSGNITIPDSGAVSLSVTSDDGCRLYVDGELVIDSWQNQTATQVSEATFAAGSTHTFTLEYFDSGYHAMLKMGMVGNDAISEKRSVWIPEGTWINAFTGEAFTGPTTIDIRCELDEMPIFVRSCAVIPLADETLTTADSDWSHLTLDYYPSASAKDTTELYEDDTKSSDYQSGKYRTTRLSTGFDKATKQATLTIGAAQGAFDGDLCFDERNWTVRVHQPAGWGELTAVTDADGNALTFEKIEADETAMALENDGAAPGGVVYELTLTADVADEQNLYFTFETSAADTATGDELPKYYGSDDTMGVDRTVTVTDAPSAVNLSKEGTIDWIYMGYNEDKTLTRKSAENQYISFSGPVKETNILKDHKVAFSWSDSTDGSAANIHNGMYTSWFVDSFEMDVTATAEEQVLTLYIGGYNSRGRLEVSDGTKGGKTTYEFGRDGGSYYKKAEITLSAEKDVNLHIKYSVISGENVTFSAATLRKVGEGESAAIPVEREINITDSMPTSVNLTAEGTGDWLSGNRTNGALPRKQGVKPAIELSHPEVWDMVDYRTAFTYTDGTSASVSNTHNGIYMGGNGSFNISVPATEKEETLKLYIGGWQSLGRLEIFDDTETKIDTYEFEDRGQSYYRMVTIKFSCEQTAYLRIRYTHVDGNGNVVFAAATFTGSAQTVDEDDSVSSTPIFRTENDLFLSSGNYESGDWTADPVMIGLSARFPEKVEKFQIKQDGKWVDLESGDVRIVNDGSYDLAFRYVDTDGKASAERTLTVNIDSTLPTLDITKSGNEQNMTFEAQTGENATVYYRVNGERWMMLDGSLTVPANEGRFYRFKAVSISGVESDILALDSTPAEGDEPITPPAPILKGDVDFSNKVDVADIMKLKALIMADRWSDEELAIGDMDGSKSLDVGDIMAIKNIIMSN